MQSDDSGATHRVEFPSDFLVRESLLALLERPPSPANIGRVEESVMPGQDMLLNPPTAKELSIRPELTASQCKCREIETTAAHRACPLRNLWWRLRVSTQSFPW